MRVVERTNETALVREQRLRAWRRTFPPRSAGRAAPRRGRNPRRRPARTSLGAVPSGRLCCVVTCEWAPTRCGGSRDAWKTRDASVGRRSRQQGLGEDRAGRRPGLAPLVSPSRPAPVAPAESGSVGIARGKRQKSPIVFDRHSAEAPAPAMSFFGLTYLGSGNVFRNTRANRLDGLLAVPPKPSSTRFTR